jgi:hypothetical protein
MIDTSKILAGLTAGLRDPLLHTFQEITSNYLEHRWEPSELNGGKFCEVVYSIADGSVSGRMPAVPSKPANMRDACRALEELPKNPSLVGDRSFRILIPRLLAGLYEIRNNRGVGHVGGDVDPNFMDATVVFNVASWILAELIRIFHGVSTKDAQEVVDALIERKIPLVWEIEGIKRVLDPKMSTRNQVLVFLLRATTWESERHLFDWTEYSNPTVFRSKVLGPLHSARLIEYDGKNQRARISPLGILEAEQNILGSKIPKA